MQEPVSVAVVGAADESTALIKILKNINFVKIKMVAGLSENASFQMARKAGIPTTTNLDKVLEIKPLDVILDLHGDAGVSGDLESEKDPSTVIFAGAALRLFLFFVQEKEQLTDIRRIVEKIYDRLGEISTTTNNLYHLPSSINEEKQSDIISLDQMEKLLLRQALHKYGNSVDGKRRAARALNISLATLYNKLKKYQIV